MTEREAFAAGFRAGMVGLEPQTIVNLVTKYYAYDYDTLVSGNRAQRVSQARKAVAWALRKFTGCRAADVARILNRDRSIFYNAFDEYETSPDPNIRQEVDDITGLIRAEVQRQYDEAIPF